MLGAREFLAPGASRKAGKARAARRDLTSSLSFLCAVGPKRGAIWGLEMSGTKIDPGAARARAAAKRNDGLIERAAKRADWAGAALESAAGDLDGAHGTEGHALTGLAEVVLDEAARVSHLAEDIGSQKES
jgi:hypothetical protein